MTKAMDEHMWDKCPVVVGIGESGPVTAHSNNLFIRSHRTTA